MEGIGVGGGVGIVPSPPQQQAVEVKPAVSTAISPLPLPLPLPTIALLPQNGDLPSLPQSLEQSVAVLGPPTLAMIVANEAKRDQQLGVTIATDVAIDDATSPTDAAMTLGRKIFASTRHLKHGPMKHMPLGTCTPFVSLR
jgi:hypothetical protein